MEVIEKLLKQQGMDWSSEMDTLLKIGKATKDNKGGGKTDNYQTAKENPSKLVRRSLGFIKQSDGNTLEG